MKPSCEAGTRWRRTELRETVEGGRSGRGGCDVERGGVVFGVVERTSGPAAVRLSVTFAGLAQAALSSNVSGIVGRAKTLVGFLAGIIGTQFIVTASLPRFVVFFAATVLHAIVFMGLYVLLDLRHFGAPVSAVAGQATANAMVGVVAVQLVELLPGAVERRPARTARRRR